MGLDNSIMAKRDAYSNTLRELAAYTVPYDKEGDFEVAYWRKCWNVRSIVREFLDAPADNKNTPITPDQLTRIINALKRLNRKTWDEDGHCIWEWREYKHYHRRQVRNLRRLRRLMDKYPALQVYFVDSY